MRWLAWALLVTLAAPALAQVQGGDGRLDGRATVKVKPKCGSEHLQLTQTWRFEATGAWTATTTAQPVLSGSKVDVTGKGRIWRLDFDAPSKLIFDEDMESLATLACNAPVALSGPTSVTRFDLKLNKRKTRAKLTLMAHGAGSTSSGSGRGTYKAILRGPWSDYVWPAP